MQEPVGGCPVIAILPGLSLTAGHSCGGESYGPTAALLGFPADCLSPLLTWVNKHGQTSWPAAQRPLQLIGVSACTGQVGVPV